MYGNTTRAHEMSRERVSGVKARAISLSCLSISGVRMRGVRVSNVNLSDAFVLRPRSSRAWHDTTPQDTT